MKLVAVCKSMSGLYAPEGLKLSEIEAFRSGNGLEALADKHSAAFTGPGFMKNADVDVLIEAGPTDFITGEPGLSYLKTALESSKHAISISKGALVLDYPGLSRLAKERKVMLKISGATAAALPTIDLLEYNLAGSAIHSISGIFTGTANFILTKMAEERMPFAEALQLAQAMGIAEPNPQFDLEGWDTACKLTILANAAFHAQIKLDDVIREGISTITKEEIQERYMNHQVIPKLVGRIEPGGQGVQAQVKVEWLPLEHPLAQVKGTTKAIQVQTDVMGDFLVIGGKSDPQAAAAAALKDLEHILQKDT